MSNFANKFKTFFKSLKNPFKLDFKYIRDAVLIIYLGLICATVYHFVYAHKIIPGVKVGGVMVGGMDYSSAKKALEDYEKTVNQELVLKDADKEFRIKSVDIGLVYDWDNSVSRAFEVGRTNNVFVDTKEKVAGLIKGVFIGASYDYEDDALSNQLSIIKGEVNTEEKKASLILENDILEGDKLVIVPSSEGRKIVDDGLYKIVINAFDRLDFSQRDLPVKVVKPQVFDDDLKAVLPKVEKIISRDVKLTHNGNVWIIEKAQLLDFISFKKENGNDLEIRLDEPKFESFTESLAQEVNELPRGQVTTDSNNKVLEFTITKEGRELDVKKFTEDFKDVFFGDNTSLELPMAVVSGPASKEKYGIYALLGEGTSHFAGSASSRIHNLTLAAERANGVLVPPGTVYSFNNSVGDISSETGYQTAYVIKGDRTVLGAGGGVCQTSTTLFRAILNAGLPVVMRYPHAYRVSYYEQDMPVGFDAAVFQPSWDLRFKNDTDGYILIQSSWNLTDSSLNFKLYGTPDGRTVEISDPIISNESPPPPALYQDDPTLAKGVVRQIDFAAWGASVKFTRTVKKGDQVLYEDVFTSNFQPWRAIYLVGTK